MLQRQDCTGKETDFLIELDSFIHGDIEIIHSTIHSKKVYSDSPGASDDILI
jgi:hypothetical protein